MKLQVLVIQSGAKWVAIGLEHCISAHATTLVGVMAAFLRDLALQITLDRDLGYEPLSETPPASEEYWERYRQSGVHLTVDLPIPTEAQAFTPDIRVAA